MMKHKGDWLLLLAAFIGGGGFISLKYLLDWGYDPFQVIFGRFLTASVCMCLVYCKRLKRITKEEWRVGSILGALLAAMFLLMTVGLQYTTPSVNAFLVNIPAVIVPFVCWGVFRQKPNRNCFLAAGMTLFGVCCLSLTAGFSSGFRGRAVTLGGGGVFAANGVSGESDKGLRFCAYCDCGESFDPCGDDGDSDVYGMGYAASDIACLRKLFLRRGILHRALFCAAKHRTAKHCAEQGGNHHYNGIYFCGGIFCDFIRRTDALQGISGVCGDFCGNGFGGKACAGEKIAVDKANKIE